VVWELPVGAGGALDVGRMEVVLPPNRDGLGASAGLIVVDKVVPPVFPNEKDDFGGAGVGDAAGVAEKGLIAPDPFPLFAKPLNTGFVIVLDDAALGVVVPLNGDPPPDVLGRLNLNLGAADPADESAGAGVASEALGGLKPNADVAGIDGSGAGVVKLEVTPEAGLGAELFVNPKLNFGVGALMVDPVPEVPFCDVAEVPKAGVDFGGTVVFVAPKMDVGFTASLLVFDVGLADSAPGALVFPNENGEPLGVVLGAANACEVGWVAEKLPIRPNKLPELCADFSGSGFFCSDCAPPPNSEVGVLLG
jgi:hypothetical protein